MSWFVVGGIAIGATAGAIAGSEKGGDDVWKGALIGGAIGGAGGWAAAPAAAGAAPAAGAALAPEAAGAIGGTGIMGAEAAAIPGIGAASAAPIAGTSTAAMPGTAGIMGAAAPEAAVASSAVPGVGAASSAPIAGTSTATMPGTVSSAFAPGMQAPVQMVQAPAATEYAMFGGDTAASAGGKEYAMFGGDTAPSATSNVANKAAVEAPKSPLEKGWSSALNWLSEPKNAMLTGVLGLGALSMFNNQNDETFGNQPVTPAGYPLSPNFKPSRYAPTRTYADGGPVQTDMYPQSQMPDRTQFATPTQMPVSREVIGSDYDATINPYTGDIPRFKEGKSIDSSRYQAMIDPNAGRVAAPDTPDWVKSRGVYHDEDPDTKYQDALTAAQTRMGKAAKGANVQLYAMQKPTPLGKLNLGPVAGREEEERKASGGIASLGGYAHGGNPRLLRGPGDGMSDDIPATIADKQPARLADGEFVVPADVVSGLGNGSTEAGAKKLHQMMDKVRVDRTGTKKQGKQIKADKYIPGMAGGGIASVKHFASGSLAIQDGTIGYYSTDEWGNPTGFSPLDMSQFAPKTSAAPTASAPSSVGYDPDYYNPQYYQNQLTSLQDTYNTQRAGLIPLEENYNSLNALKGFDPTWYAKNNPDVIAAGVDPTWHWNRWGKNEYVPGESGLARTPYEGWQPGAEMRNDALVQEAANKIAAQNKAMSATQEQMVAPQEQLNRLAASNIKYDPYTVANRPSSAEPQFYGNIYKPEYENYARPGYDMNAQLGVWNNEYGGNAAPTARQNRIAQMSYDQQAAAQQSLENAQAAALKSRQLINQAVNTGKNQPPVEEQKRKGGILAIKKAKKK